MKRGDAIFGLQTANSWTRDNSSNNFLYNEGSELNSTTGMYDLPFRNYDAALGRFFQVDALAHTSSDMTPYHYAGNNPIGANDPTGLMKKSPWTDEQEQQAAQGMSSAWSFDAGTGGGGGYLSGYGADSPYSNIGRNGYSAADASFAADVQAVQSGLMSVTEFAASYGTNVTDSYLITSRMSVELSQNGVTYGYALDLNITGKVVAVTRSNLATNDFAYFNYGGYAAEALASREDSFFAQGSSASGPNGWDQFWSGFGGSQNPSNYGSASTVTSTSLFWVDGVGNSVAHTAKTAGERLVRMKITPALKTIGVVGGVTVAGMELYQGLQDGKLSYGESFKVGANLLQAGLVFVPGIGLGVLAFNGVDFLTGVITGTSITDRIANGIDNIGK